MTTSYSFNNDLTVDDNCDTLKIGGEAVREIPIRLLRPGARFALMLTTGRAINGTLVRIGPGTVAVVLDNSDKSRSFTDSEGTLITLRQPGEVVYWSPGTAVVDLHLRDETALTRWTTKGGTGVGPSKNSNEETENSAMSEKTATLPIAGAVKSKAAKKAAAKPPKVHKEKVPKELNFCLDGCGEKVTGRFRQGHDARYYSLLKKVSRDEMPFNELPKLMQTSLGNKAGVTKALAASKH